MYRKLTSTRFAWNNCIFLWSVCISHYKTQKLILRWKMFLKSKFSEPKKTTKMRTQSDWPFTHFAQPKDSILTPFYSRKNVSKKFIQNAFKLPCSFNLSNFLLHCSNRYRFVLSITVLRQFSYNWKSTENKPKFWNRNGIIQIKDIRREGGNSNFTEYRKTFR